MTDCVRLGVAANLSLMQKALERDEKRFGIEIARRVYIPTATLQADESRDAQRVRTLLQGVSSTGVLGTKLEIENEIRDVPAGGRNAQTQAFSLTQPLMKNFGRAVTGYEIDVARIEYEAGVEKFRADLDAFIFDVMSLCLDLSVAGRNLVIQEQACARARQQFEDTRHDIELGAIAEREIYLVEENLVAFEIRRDTTRQEIAQLELELRRLLNIDPAVEDRITVRNVLSEEDTLPPASFAGALEIARQESPALRLERLLLNKSVSALERQRIQYQPRLDLLFDYRLREGGTGADNAYTVGVEYGIPLDRGGDRAALEQARLATAIRKVAGRDADSRLAYTIREILLRIDYLTRIIAAKHRATELSQKKLDAETEKYRNGYSTLADLVRFQRELEEAQIDEIESQVSLRKSRLRLLLAQGTLHRQFGISVGN
ncbi:MAG TPA: TolC family protein [Candidatus Ozemobacteraceae bacterium]|nr:TolC family protein [Candidatus Ozemobacteraceae bacterium]